MKNGLACTFLLMITLLTGAAVRAQVQLNVATGTSGQDLELLQAGVDRFMIANPDILVRVLLMPELTDDRLTVLRNFFEVGTPEVDVLQLDSVWTQELAPHLVDLSGLPGAAASDPYLREVLTVDGRLVSMPWFVTRGVLFYRKDLLDRHGFAPPATWSELERMARTIQAAERSGNPDFWGYLWQGGSYEGLTVNALEWWSSVGAGSLIEPPGLITVNNPAAVQMLERARGWIGDISPPAVLGYDEGDARDEFLAGNAAFMRNWQNIVARLRTEPQLEGRFGLAPLPGNPPTGLYGGAGLAVSAYSLHRAEALRLVGFLTGEDEQIRAAVDGARIPTWPALYQHPEVLAALPFLPELLPRGSADGLRRPLGAARPLWSELSRATYRTVSEVLSGEDEAAPALARLAASLQLFTGLPEGAPAPAP